MSATIGRAIKRIRLARGMKQDELSRLVGVSRSHLNYIEANKRNPSWEMLQKIAQGLRINVSILALLTEADDSKIAPFMPLIYHHIYEEN